MKEIESQDTCLNCSAPLKRKDHYCRVCGQKKLGPHDFTVRHLVVDSIGDYFHFDGKFFRTIKSLLLRPGAMTLDFLAGKRRMYIQPFKLFLFISLVYFILIGFSSHKPGNKTETAIADTSLVEGRNSLKNSLVFGNDTISHNDAREAVDRMGEDALLDSLNPGDSWFEHEISKKLLNAAIMGSDKIVERLLHNASRVVFLLIPVMALLLKLLYIRRKILYFDHLIFALHTHTLFFLALIFYVLMDYFVGDLLLAIVFVGILIYLVMALKRVYGQRWGMTLMKFFLLFMGYLVIALPVFAIVLFLVSFLF